MTTSTLLLVVVSFVLAVGLSFFQYFYKANDKSKNTYLLAFLRFISIFGLLILLINPVITSSKLEIEKTPLVVVMDNSKSIKELKSDQEARNVLEKLTSNTEIADKYDVQLYQFDRDFGPLDSLNFIGNQSILSEAGKSVKSILRNKKFPTVLISDGNQTSGDDFVYSFSPENKVFPMVMGDTTHYLDLKINQINANKYAFLQNKFPVEIFVQCNESKSLNATFSIFERDHLVSSQNINFSANKTSQTLSVLLPANSIGVRTYTAVLSSHKKEKNTYNNKKKFAVEVIDQRSEIGIVSTINHPDIGMLKRSIESNSQRKVTVINPLNVNDLEKFNVLIYYQPNSAFKKVFELNSKKGLNTWTITGTATDFNFLNQNQDRFEFNMASQKEDYLADFVPEFNLFAIDNIGFEKFPPLENPYGKITSKVPTSTLLQSNIRSIKSNMPLLSFYENQGRREAYFFGSSIWRWRSKSYLESNSFEKFDLFLDKIIQFLSSNDQKKSLIVTHERFFNLGDVIEITAQYFNKNYEFDEKANLTIDVVNSKTKKKKKYDLLKSTNSFKVNLEGLEAGSYTFSVKEMNSKATYSSSFEILDFDVEKQFSSANLTKMTQLAAQSNAQVYFPNQVDQFIKTLVDSKEYVSIEKNTLSKQPLIETILLLILIAIALASEWFIRKYKGLL